MSNSRYDELIFEFIEFIFSIGERLINACVSCLIIYGIVYIIFRYLIFRNDKADWDDFAGMIRSGVKDAAAAFKNVMPGIKEVAKNWADEKISELRR